MYPQSLQTHSPAQNWATRSASSAFWASVFRFPNTEREVEEAAVGVVAMLRVIGETIARWVVGANASVDVAKRQIAEMIAMMLFMFDYCSFIRKWDGHGQGRARWYLSYDRL
mmetsp:Transcript_284/g.530  ORF Transcript_284/g.530 Transcript_284/m.530 type:complete len:112 (+) Transcript_284:419-754(+)